MKQDAYTKVEIIAVGSELLTPFYHDTNSHFLTQRLNDIGLEVSFKSTVSDSWDDLLKIVSASTSRAQIILIMGGLGPTQDDRTREAVAAALEKKLVFKEDILKNIKNRFKQRGYSMPSINRKQAYIINGADVLDNNNGTAPGLWLETDQRIIILLPGPPQELKPMFETHVWPRLQRFRAQHVERRILKITGLTESKIETLISDLFPKGPFLRITTLARPGQIELHLIGLSTNNSEEALRRIRGLEMKIRNRLTSNIFSSSGEELEEVIGNLLRAGKKTLSVAESCTGGYLGHRITNVPGSSDYFLQGFLAYSNMAKTKLLGIPIEMLEEHGAVNKDVARSMALNIRTESASDFGLAITGIAGPTGGSPEKPVGLVYTALAWKNGIDVHKNIFLGNRNAIKYQSSQKALDMLRRHLLKYGRARSGIDQSG